MKINKIKYKVTRLSKEILFDSLTHTHTIGLENNNKLAKMASKFNMEKISLSFYLDSG